jgi:hypothetical protein
MGIDSFNIKSGCLGKLMSGRMNNTGDNGCETRKRSYREFIKRLVRISALKLERKE